MLSSPHLFCLGAEEESKCYAAFFHMSIFHAMPVTPTQLFKLILFFLPSRIHGDSATANSARKRRASAARRRRICAYAMRCSRQCARVVTR